MKGRLFTSAAALGLLAVLAAPIHAQGHGKGHEKNHDNAGKSEQAHGRGVGQEKSKTHSQSQSVRGTPGGGKGHGSATAQRAKEPHGAVGTMGTAVGTMGTAVGRENEAASRGRDNARFARYLRTGEVRPSLRQFIESNRSPERVAAGAIAYAYARGINERDFVITPKENRVFVRNRKGDVLLDLDDDRARNMGSWTVNVLDDRTASGAPSFCRSGAGHPVWGRQWCIDKGFGLGSARNIRWGVTDDLDQAIILRPVSAGNTIASDVLARMLGTPTMDRLALHAITLGLVDPLVGRWLGEPNGQRVLLVQSGNTPVTEFVDTNRDDRADRALIALKPW